MPSVCRRIVVLLVVALLGVGGGPIAAAHAQGAGDQQYQDPFGDEGSGSSGGDGGSGSSNSGSGSSGSGGDDITPLSPSPQTSGGTTGSTGSTTSGTSAGTTGTGTTTPTATAGTLPDTGLDTRVLLLAGAVLVLLGAGLRMRNAPERF